MEISKTKKALRKHMLQKRGEFPISEKLSYDLGICEKLKRLVLKENYKTVHLYLPMGDEVDITPFIEFCLEQQITVVAPKTLPKRKLKNLILNAVDDVEAGVFGTTHPANTVEYFGNYDLIVIPGLAFDNVNYRLGYGGGYYDNFLVNYPKANKVGIFYPFQKVEKVPKEAYDIPLDQVLTISF